MGVADPGSGGPREWRALGVVDPGIGGPWEWRTLGVADPNPSNVAYEGGYSAARAFHRSDVQPLIRHRPFPVHVETRNSQSTSEASWSQGIVTCELQTGLKSIVHLKGSWAYCQQTIDRVFVWSPSSSISVCIQTWPFHRDSAS